MRVTGAMREYIRKAVLAKVRDKVQKAELAKGKALAERDARIAKVRKIAEEVAARAQKEFVERAAKLGLTWVPDSYNYGPELDEKDGNRAFNVCVSQDDFAETLSSSCYAFKAVKSAERDRFYGAVKEPQRIRDAATAPADRLLFELEIGKVAKKELDETLAGLEVEV